MRTKRRNEQQGIELQRYTVCTCYKALILHDNEIVTISTDCTSTPGMEAWREIGGELARTAFLAFLAETYRMEGDVEEGLVVLAEALRLVDQHSEHMWEVALHLLKGDFLLAPFSNNQTETELCFKKALEVSQSQQAKSLELRAAISLAKLWQSQGKREEARQLLEPVYSWFTEGFDTIDLIAAKMLLGELEK